jgi:type IV pilus assembly protein PilQ
MMRLFFSKLLSLICLAVFFFSAPTLAQANRAYLVGGGGDQTHSLPSKQPSAGLVNVSAFVRDDGVSVVKLDFDSDLSGSTFADVFLMRNPTRLVVDLNGATTKLSSMPSGLRAGLVSGYSFLNLASKTRMVVNLSAFKAFKQEVSGKSLLLLLAPVEAPTTSNVSADAVARDVENDKSNLISSVRFSRSGNDGLIIVELPEKAGNVDVSQNAKTLEVVLSGVRLLPSLQKKMDVTDFSTAVQFVSVVQSARDTVKISVQSSGAWAYTSWQKDRSLVLQVSPQKSQSNEGELLTKVPKYVGDKLSVNFQQVEVRALLQVIADFTGLNVVVGDSVSGMITLRLNDVPWDQVLDIVLQNKGLAMKRVGNVLMVGSKDELVAKEKLAFETQTQAVELEQLVLETFVINYQKASDVSKLISDERQRILSKRGSVVVDTNTNQMFVSDIPSKIEEVKRIVSKVDIPIRQVVIEARVVEASDNFNRSLGVKLGYNDRRSTVYKEVPLPGGGTVKVPAYQAGSNLGGGNLVSVAGNFNALQLVTPQNREGADDSSDYRLASGVVGDGTNFVNLPAIGASGFSPTSLALSLYRSGMTEFINLELSALESQALGRVVSSPRVVTTDQKPATIEAGTELPYSVVTTSTTGSSVSTSFKKITLKLQVTPQITPEGDVILTVELNKDTVGELTNAGYAINTKQLKTTVLVENGGTVVIGGIYSQEQQDVVAKVPVLGDVPVVGMLFRNKTKKDTKSETLIFITPRVLDGKSFL